MIALVPYHIFQLDDQPFIAECLGFFGPLGVILDRLPFGGQDRFYHLTVGAGCRHRTRLGRRFTAEGHDLVSQKLSVLLLVRYLGQEELGQLRSIWATVGRLAMQSRLKHGQVIYQQRTVRFEDFRISDPK